jgi:hypothetical protein
MYVCKYAGFGHLDKMDDENGVDTRVLAVPDVPGGLRLACPGLGVGQSGNDHAAGFSRAVLSLDQRHPGRKLLA